MAVFLHDDTTRWDEPWHLAELTTDILVDTGADISPKPFRAGAYREDQPLMREIARLPRDDRRLDLLETKAG